MSGALAVAVAVKLTRVVLLAPMLAVVSVAERRRHAAAPVGERPPLVPLFVLGFLLMAVLRSAHLVPAPVLEVATFVDGLLLAAGMFALGTAVRLRSLFRSGLPVLVLGLLSSALIAALVLVGALLLT